MSNQKKFQRGVAAVELAVVLPLFGILLLGILEIGGMARDHQALENGAREGARFSAMEKNRKSYTGAEDRIKDCIIAYLDNENITVAAGDITVDQTKTITVGGETITATEITIDYPRPLLFPGISRWISLSTTLQANAVFRNFYQ